MIENTADSAAADNATADDYRLERFVAVMALDFRRLQEYLKDPEKAMAAAGLNDWEQRLLREGTFQQVAKAFYKPGRAPAPNPQTDGGGP